MVMRHARASVQPPAGAQADPGNTARERQLDPQGRRDVQDLGEALRRLQLPVGEVLVSPSYRTRQTAALTGVGSPQVVAQLAALDEQGGLAEEGGYVGWLREAASTPPAPGSNTLIVTHAPNMQAAFGAGDLAGGDMLVWQPPGLRLLARIPVGAWKHLPG